MDLTKPGIKYYDHSFRNIVTVPEICDTPHIFHIYLFSQLYRVYEPEIGRESEKLDTSTMAATLVVPAKYNPHLYKQILASAPLPIEGRKTFELQERDITQ